LQLQAERMRRSGLAHAPAWGLDDDTLESPMLDCARWLAAA
jgi:hypothetical protein